MKKTKTLKLENSVKPDVKEQIKEPVEYWVGFTGNLITGYKPIVIKQ